MRNVTNMSNKKITDTNEFYELHGQIMLNNVDITDWSSDTLIQFRVGMHISRHQRDWLIITLKPPVVGSESPLSDWSCVDAFHEKHIRFDTWDGTNIMVDSY